MVFDEGDGRVTYSSKDFGRTAKALVAAVPERLVHRSVERPANRDDAFSADPAKMATVTMENYDPQFASIARGGDILVSGFNFGCGSSREQAATAILATGIPLVVAGSFGNIFSRNSINNALMGVEVPRLIERLRAAFGAAPPPAGQAATAVEAAALTAEVSASAQGSVPETTLTPAGTAGGVVTLG